MLDKATETSDSSRNIGHVAPLQIHSPLGRRSAQQSSYSTQATTASTRLRQVTSHTTALFLFLLLWLFLSLPASNLHFNHHLELDVSVSAQPAVKSIDSPVRFTQTKSLYVVFQFLARFSSQSSLFVGTSHS